MIQERLSTYCDLHNTLLPRGIKISLIYLKVLSKKRVLKSILFIVLNNYIVNILEIESAQFLQHMILPFELQECIQHTFVEDNSKQLLKSFTAFGSVY